MISSLDSMTSTSSDLSWSYYPMYNNKDLLFAYYLLTNILIFMKPIGYVVVSKTGFVSMDTFGMISDLEKNLFETIGEAMRAASILNEKLGHACFRVYSIYNEEFLH